MSVVAWLELSMNTLFNTLPIVIGAIIMLVSIIKAKSLLNALPLVPKNQRSYVRKYLLLHRGLMVFFAIGYLIVLVAFSFNLSFITNAFVSLIFLFGAIFVFIGIDIESRLLSEVQKTLHGVLPICTKCKKIRTVSGNIKDPKSWEAVDVYISKKADVDFSHSYCPDCYHLEIKNLKNRKKKSERP